VLTNAEPMSGLLGVSLLGAYALFALGWQALLPHGDG